MNVYDFDNTIYNGDSTLDFYLFCLKKNPKIIFVMPKQIYSVLQYLCGKITKTKFKECFYSFLPRMNNIENTVIEFWNKNEAKIKSWYLEQHKGDDVIITASPEFLIREICNRIHVNTLIASKVSPYDGKYTGINCYGEEKVRRYKEIYQNVKIDKIYSDSMSDLPLAYIAKEAYLVKSNNIEVWKK